MSINNQSLPEENEWNTEPVYGMGFAASSPCHSLPEFTPAFEEQPSMKISNSYYSSLVSSSVFRQHVLCSNRYCI